MSQILKENKRLMFAEVTSQVVDVESLIVKKRRIVNEDVEKGNDWSTWIVSIQMKCWQVNAESGYFEKNGKGNESFGEVVLQKYIVAIIEGIVGSINDRRYDANWGKWVRRVWNEMVSYIDDIYVH